MILEKLGIYGVSSFNENCILAGLLQGDPVMLIGSHGTAKTETIECIANALREHDKKSGRQPAFSYQIYDTSKLDPEALVGFPDPSLLKEGKMGFIKMPSTIWDKDLVCFDEINRSEKSRQANLFEIIRSRRLNGQETNNHFIFSAMNPLGDSGTGELVDALTDRHTFFLVFEPFENIDEENKNRIIKRVGRHESVGLRYWDHQKFDCDVDDSTINDHLANVGEEIRTIIVRAKSLYEDLHSGLSDRLAKIINRIAVEFLEERTKRKDTKISIGNTSISGRRAGIILRAICSVRAIQLVKAELLNCPIPDLEGTITNSIIKCIPIGIGSKITNDGVTRIVNIITDIVRTQYALLFNNDDSADKLYQLFYEKNPLKVLHTLISTDLNRLSSTKIWSKLYEKIKDSEFECILSLLRRQGFPIPAHIELNEQKVKLELAKKEGIIKGDYHKYHLDFINNIRKNAAESGSKALEICAKKAIVWFSDQPNQTSEQIVENLASINNFVNDIKNKLNNKKESNVTVGQTTN